MNFRIIFYTGKDKKDKKNVAEFPIGEIGLDAIDEIRSKFGQSILLDDIRIDGCPYWPERIVCYINEENARKSGVFKGRRKIEVLIPENYFSTYVKLEFISFKIAYYKTSENILRRLFKLLDETYRTGVNIKWGLDRRKIVNDWIADGCPKKWGFKE